MDKLLILLALVLIGLAVARFNGEYRFSDYAFYGFMSGLIGSLIWFFGSVFFLAVAPIEKNEIDLGESPKIVDVQRSGRSEGRIGVQVESGRVYMGDRSEIDSSLKGPKLTAEQEDIPWFLMDLSEEVYVVTIPAN